MNEQQESLLTTDPLSCCSTRLSREKKEVKKKKKNYTKDVFCILYCALPPRRCVRHDHIAARHRYTMRIRYDVGFGAWPAKNGRNKGASVNLCGHLTSASFRNVPHFTWPCFSLACRAHDIVCVCVFIKLFGAFVRRREEMMVRLINETMRTSSVKCTMDRASIRKEHFV